jgi:VWFA-related protein
MFAPFKRSRQKIQIGLCLPAAAAVLITLLLPAPVASQEEKPVSIYVTVEQDGNLIEGLTAQNFRLSEDGKSQPFRLEKPEFPASIALLLEDSQSSWSYSDDIEGAIEGFLAKAKEGNWYALATFAHQLNVLVDFTKQIGRLREAFQELGYSQWNETDTYDAIYQMLDKMSLLPGRRVLIVIGSGFDSFSRHSFDDVQKKLQSSNVTVFCVGLGTMLRGQYEPYLSDSERMDLLMSQNFLRMLADESGGDSWFPDEMGAYSDIMKGIMQTLSLQYRLVYIPKEIHDGKLHKIEVEAFQVVNDQRRNFKVRARKGWRF